MYLIRLIRLTDVNVRYIAKLAVEKGNRQRSPTFFPGCGVSGKTLNQPGQCMVVRVDDEPATLVVTYLVDQASDLDSHTLKIDRIDDSGRLPGPATNERNTTESRCSSNVPLQLIGRLFGGSQIRAEPTEWLGDPEGQEALEGITVTCTALPADLELFTTVEIHPLGKLPEAAFDTYAGLKGYALPITGVQFRLSGKSAHNYELWVDGSFANWGIVSAGPGTDLALSGPTRTEALVALRLVVRPRVSK